MTASMCERAGLDLGWLMPCDMPDDDGEPCRYHQGVADVVGALRTFLDASRGRLDLAKDVAKGEQNPRLRDYGIGVVDGLVGAHDVITTFLETGTVTLDVA